MVRSQKSIGGVVGVAVGNAPYKIGDRTAPFVISAAGMGCIISATAAIEELRPFRIEPLA